MACKVVLEQKLQDILHSLAEIQESANAETKSSAGDKHETARAMAQNEIELASVQLENTRQMLRDLERIDPAKSKPIIGSGSLIKTDTAVYFIGVAIGKLNSSGSLVFAISPQSPIAKEMLGKRAGDHFQFNGKKIAILAVD